MLKAVAVPYFAMSCVWVVLGAGARAEDVFPAPLRLATTPTELVALRASPTFGTVRDSAVKAADALLADLPVAPTGEGNWTFYYACPDDGTDLVSLSAAVRQCPGAKCLTKGQ